MYWESATFAETQQQFPRKFSTWKPAGKLVRELEEFTGNLQSNANGASPDQRTAAMRWV
jgi:hypothetical protein